MAQCKTVVTPVLTHSSYHSLVLSHLYYRQIFDQISSKQSYAYIYYHATSHQMFLIDILDDTDEHAWITSAYHNLVITKLYTTIA